MFFGRASSGLRGFRPRTDTNYVQAFAVILGMGSGYYIFAAPLREASSDVVKEHGGKPCSNGAAPSDRKN